MNAVTRNTHAPSNDERRASWAFRYFLQGFHRAPQKPRIRMPVTVPADRVVKDCPQPDPPEYRPIQYGSPSRADRDVPATPVRASPSMAPAHGPDLPASVAGITLHTQAADAAKESA